MPRIPRIQTGTPNLPLVQPGQLAEPYEALTRAGQRVQATGAHVFNIADELNRREKAAEDTLEAMRIDRIMRERVGQVAESYLPRMDYQNFDTDLQNHLNTLHDELPKNMSPELNEVVEKAFSQQAFHLSNTVRAKKYKVMDDIGRIEIGAITDQAMKDYSEAVDDYQRDAVKKNYEIRLLQVRNSKLVDPVWIDAHIQNFDKSAEKFAADADDVAADKAIMADPAQAHIDLSDPKNFPHLPQKVRQDKVEKSLAAMKVWQNEQEKKLKEEIKVAHDADEKAIGDLFAMGKLTKALTLVQDSKMLSGDEKRTWTTSINERSKEGEIVDPAVEATHIVIANKKISNKEDPDKIRDYVIQNLHGGNREQYILKLQAKLDQEHKDGISEGYHDIERIIFPPARGITLESAIQTPQQTEAIMKAQVALDGWYDAQIKAGKYPSKDEIRQKSWALANDYQVSFGAKIGYIEEKAKKTAEEMKKIAEEKVRKAEEEKKGIVSGTIRHTPEGIKMFIEPTIAAKETIKQRIREERRKGATIPNIKKWLEDAKIDPAGFEDELK